MLAAEIKRLIDSYRALNPGLEYIVFIGNDDVVPFYRVPDKAAWPTRRTYVPPVLDPTASQASLKLGYVLTQDSYGRSATSRVWIDTFPMPDLAVGRLIETAAEATGHARRLSGDRRRWRSSRRPAALVTGYDFLADAANAVRAELDGRDRRDGRRADPAERQVRRAIPARGRPTSCATALLGHAARPDVPGRPLQRQGSALAADFTTRMVTTELAGVDGRSRERDRLQHRLPLGLQHGRRHAVQGVTPDADWAQAFARKGATFIGGTGYQYGDTEIIEYSERLYLEFAQRCAPAPARSRSARRWCRQARLPGRHARHARHPREGAAGGDAVRPADAQRQHARARA